MSPQIHSVLALFGWLILFFAAAAFCAQFKPGDWYAALAKPAWTPPNSIFAPAWTLLYTLMAIAAWLVWQRRGLQAGALPLALFVAQIVLNALWSWLFFGLHRMDLAFFELCLFWLLLLATLIAFWQVRTLAGGLLVPYLLWVSFAGALNFAIWRLNV